MKFKILGIKKKEDKSYLKLERQKDIEIALKEFF